MLLDAPLRREDDKISHCHTRGVAGAREDSEDGGILWRPAVSSSHSTTVMLLTAWSNETALTTMNFARSYLYG